MQPEILEKLHDSHQGAVYVPKYLCGGLVFLNKLVMSLKDVQFV